LYLKVSLNTFIINNRISLVTGRTNTLL